MSDGAKGRWIITVSAVMLLLGAAVLWWDLAVEGFTRRGFFSATLFTVLAVFWFYLRSRPAKS